jgi:hypothetical protein
MLNLNFNSFCKMCFRFGTSKRKREIIKQLIIILADLNDYPQVKLISTGENGRCHTCQNLTTQQSG